MASMHYELARQRFEDRCFFLYNTFLKKRVYYVLIFCRICDIIIMGYSLIIEFCKFKEYR